MHPKGQALKIARQCYLSFSAQHEPKKLVSICFDSFLCLHATGPNCPKQHSVTKNSFRQEKNAGQFFLESTSHILQVMIEAITKSQGFKVAGQIHILQALVEETPKRQVLQMCRQGDFYQSLIKASAKDQSLKSVGQMHMSQTLVELIAKSQALQIWGPADVIQSLIKFLAKADLPQCCWQNGNRSIEVIERQVLKLRTPSAKLLQALKKSTNGQTFQVREHRQALIETLAQ